jgi:hypothetical protein
LTTNFADALPFLPDRRRAERLDTNLRLRLADSLSGIADALQAAGIDGGPVRRTAAGILSSPVSPRLFALHAGLVEAILDEDSSAAEALIAGLGRLPHGAEPDIAFVTIDDDILGLPGLAALYARLAVDDSGSSVTLAPLGPEPLGDAADRARAALDLMGAAAPELAAEFAALVRQVVLVRAADNSLRDFGGASSFHIWGALFLNAERYRSRVEIAEGLVHEAAHLLLFGESGGDRVVLNDDDERHVSPLRDDPRPLDGIAHATFVLARMTYCVDALLKSGLLAPAEQTEAEEALARNRLDYADGASVVRAHARLTDAGARMLDAAAAYMGR